MVNPHPREPAGTLKGCVAMESSASDFGRDNGLIHEVVVTGRKAGWGKDEWSKLAHNQKIMRQIADVLNGKAVIKRDGYHIDLSAAPKIPGGFPLVVEEHGEGGMLWWDTDKIHLHQFPEQSQFYGTPARDIRQALPHLKPAGLVPLNANVLDFLLENQHLIPQEWKKPTHTLRGDRRMRVFFFGTVYRNIATAHPDTFEVRYLSWYDNAWRDHTLQIGSPQRASGNNFYIADTIAMLKAD